MHEEIGMYQTLLHDIHVHVTALSLPHMLCITRTHDTRSKTRYKVIILSKTTVTYSVRETNDYCATTHTVYNVPELLAIFNPPSQFNTHTFAFYAATMPI